jgi:hypothetical protein
MVNDCYHVAMPRKLTEEDCLFAVRSGDFAESVRGAAPLVAVILTQSWCPQWRFMQSYLAEAEQSVGERGAIYVVEYDREPFYRDFMTFKEDIFQNREIPYVRYYRAGLLHAESNFISKQGFLSKLGVG